ncbi:conidiation protein 6-domain-containing protein [Phanerochaete sordida]|uniref:Conidiation protein 6-domain-containing protein n=1 Tax=Phanerochaete sordida TaxID=48140 RepID=A0A9P3G5E5_9APHY|nr:conidiation protein 6-domain-containing protein [Phanerochaete sordida]
MSLVRRHLTQHLRPALYGAARAAGTHAAKGAEADPADVARGLKGALHNANVSPQAKRADRAKLKELEESGAIDPEEAHLRNVERGHKANLSNPNTSKEAKKHSREVLKDLESKTR